MRPSVFECDMCKSRVDELLEDKLSKWTVAIYEDGMLKLYRWPSSCMCTGAAHLCSPECRDNYIGKLFGYSVREASHV